MAEPTAAESKPSQPAGLSRWVPSLPGALISTLTTPFGNEASSATTSNGGNGKDGSSQSQPKRQSLFGSIFSTTTTTSPPQSSSSSHPNKDDDATSSDMFAEPDDRSNSEHSRDGSVDDDGTGRPRRGSKKSNRPKTCYSICHPPPASTARQRLHRRPRSLLQLHKRSATARPRPAFEVVPSANFSVRLTKAITRIYKAKHGLCPQDLVVLKAEKYTAEEREEEGDEEQQVRDIVALICKGKKGEDGCATGKAKICLPDGRSYEAYATTNGGYEFFTTDEHGLGVTARWVPKKNSRGKDGEARKFNFSTISPNSRRHPVIATLSPTGLEINDTYKMPDPTNTTPLNTPRQASTILEDTMAEEDPAISGDELPQLYHTTDHALRELITISGIWVLFKESWSSNFKYDEKELAPVVFPTVARSPSLKHSPKKSGTFSPIAPMSATSGTPPASPGIQPLEKRASIKSVSSSVFGGRRQSLLSRSNRASHASVTEDPHPIAAATAANNNSTDDFNHSKSRSRANSQSTVLVHRAASNRRKNKQQQQQQATWRPDLLASTTMASEQPPQQLIERSTEDLQQSSSRSPTPTRPRVVPGGMETASSSAKESEKEGEGEDEDENENEDDDVSPSRRRDTPRGAPAVVSPEILAKMRDREVKGVAVSSAADGKKEGREEKKKRKAAAAGAADANGGSASAAAANGKSVKDSKGSGKSKGRSILRKVFCQGGASDG